MRTIYLMSIAMILILVAGCEDDSDSTTGPAGPPSIDIVILVDGAAVDTLRITEENEGDTIRVIHDNEILGELEFSILEVSNLDNNPELQTVFNLLARKNGCFTQGFAFRQNTIFEIDFATSFVPYDPSTNCGVVVRSGGLADGFMGLLKDKDIEILTPDYMNKDTIYVDADGKFITDLEAGEYVARILNPYPLLMDTSFQLESGYNELNLPVGCMIWAKPNIYLYPTETTTLDVSIEFPQGGNVTVSDPHYPDEWRNIKVEPDGTIDGEYGYLFYEAETPAIAQQSAGWIVAREDLEDFFDNNLRRTGFSQAEIDDFIEWWIPRLTDSAYYALYPQYKEQIDPVVELRISPQPDNILRLTYYVAPLDSPDLVLVEPAIPAFDRTGFVVAEWGLILTEGSQKQNAKE